MFSVFQSIPVWSTQSHIKSALFSRGRRRRLGRKANDLPSLGPRLRTGVAVPLIHALVFVALTLWPWSWTFTM